MTEFALAPAVKWDAANSPYRTPRVMLEQNELQAYRVRGNGTMRHVSLYPVHSTDREVAEYISDRTDMDGASVHAVARELHVSPATVRRYLEGLELTEEIEAGEWDGLAFNADGDPVWTRGLDLTDGDDPEEASAPRTRTVRRCNCGVALTYRNRADKTRGALGFEDTCAKCYDHDGWVNTHSDQGHSATNRDADCPVCATLPVEDPAKCNCAAEALGNNWHTPGCPLAPVVSEDAPGAHNEDEPAGTPDDEVEEALAASLAQKAKDAELLARNQARFTRTRPTPSTDAPKTNALAVCFCGDSGAHGLGSDGCKHPAPVRKVRSH